MARLEIYTRFPPPATIAEIIVKIMVELLSTIALMTKQIRQRRRCETVLDIYFAVLKATQ